MCVLGTQALLLVQREKEPSRWTSNRPLPSDFYTSLSCSLASNISNALWHMERQVAGLLYLKQHGTAGFSHDQVTTTHTKNFSSHFPLRHGREEQNYISRLFFLFTPEALFRVSLCIAALVLWLQEKKN